MKKIVALILCASFILLCSCSGKDSTPTTNNVNYVNEGDWSGIQREMVTDWFDGDVNGVERKDLPEDFPAVPDETSNISIKKHKAEESSAGYASDWTELTFSTPRQGVNKLSDDLRKAGYKGTVRYLPSEGWAGAWQNGKNFIRIADWEYEYDGSYIITLHITECLKPSYPELAEIVPVFDGFTSAKGSYYEFIDGKPLAHNFDGKFHAEWQIEFSRFGAIAGTSKEEFEAYSETLDKSGFESQRSLYSTADDCIVYLYEGYNKKTGIFVAAFFNESLQTLEIRYSNLAPEEPETETATETVTQ